LLFTGFKCKGWIHIVSEQQYTKLFASYSTSFIAPSLSQLYGFYSPNPDLDPEENRTIEGGIEFKFNNNFRVSALYFNREEQNVITYTYGFPLLLNVADKVNTKGVELEIDSNITDHLSFNANYTFVENKDATVVRVPKHKVNAQLAYDISKRTFASLNYQYTYDRIVNDFSTFPASEINLNAFSIINFYISHSALANKVVFFAGIDNVLNEDFNELLGFVSKGRNVRLGFKLNL
jgi:vitamin B12 transporter